MIWSLKEILLIIKKSYKINKAVKIIKDKDTKNSQNLRLNKMKTLTNKNKKTYYEKINNLAKFIIDND